MPRAVSVGSLGFMSALSRATDPTFRTSLVSQASYCGSLGTIIYYYIFMGMSTVLFRCLTPKWNKMKLRPGIGRNFLNLIEFFNSIMLIGEELNSEIVLILSEFPTLPDSIQNHGLGSFPM